MLDLTTNYIEHYNDVNILRKSKENCNYLISLQLGVSGGIKCFHGIYSDIKGNFRLHEHFIEIDNDILRNTYYYFISKALFDKKKLFLSDSSQSNYHPICFYKITKEQYELHALLVKFLVKGNKFRIRSNFNVMCKVIEPLQIYTFIEEKDFNGLKERLNILLVADKL